MGISDDVFDQWAKDEEKAQEAAKAAKANRGSGGTFEQINYTALEPNRTKIVRAVGGPPDSNVDNTTARTVRISWIVGDDGKKFRCILPERSDNPDHILWRIISRVNETEWRNKEKFFVNKDKHPDIFAMVNSNGFTGTSPQAKYDRGWEGRNVLIMNVIDREMMEWHKANKSCVLLSKNVYTTPQGNQIFDEGVPSYGFINLLTNLFKYYKSWEKYDLGITRTGMKETPYRVINAGKYIEEVPEDLKGLVVSGPLTEEEENWKRYDLSKLFGLTKYTKIYNKLHLGIARIDAVLGTRFLKELEDEVEKEKASSANEPSDSEENNGFQDNFDDGDKPKSEDTAAPVRPRPSAAPVVDVSALKHFNKLSEKEQMDITNVVVKGDKVVSVEYASKSSQYACPECGVPAPDWFTTCPNCGQSF